MINHRIDIVVESVLKILHEIGTGIVPSCDSRVNDANFRFASNNRLGIVQVLNLVDSSSSLFFVKSGDKGSPVVDCSRGTCSRRS